MSTDTGHGEGGQMDIADHVKTWHSFTQFTKWLAIGAIGLMAFLAIFRTHG